MGTEGEYRKESKSMILRLKLRQHRLIRGRTGEREVQVPSRNSAASCHPIMLSHLLDNGKYHALAIGGRV
jgi:hypothetical protein